MHQGCAEAAANIIRESDSTNQRLFLIQSGQIESGAPCKDTGDTHRRTSRVVSCNFCPEASPSQEDVAPPPGRETLRQLQVHLTGTICKNCPRTVPAQPRHMVSTRRAADATSFYLLQGCCGGCGP